MGTVEEPSQALTEMVEGCGRAVWYRFRSWADLDDCRQEAWLCYYSHKAHFDSQLQLGRAFYVSKAIRNWVGEYCRALKANASGYSASDEQFYSRRRVRTLLEFFLCGETLPSPGTGIEGKVKSTPSDGTESHVELLDIGQAWELLDQDSRDALWASYGPDGGESVTDGQRQATRRALGRLVDLLNGNT